MAVDPEAFKAVMGRWPSGVTVVTTADEDGPAGMTASSFSSVSLDPPLVSVCVHRKAATHDRLMGAGTFAVNILSTDQIDHGRRFAGMLPDVEDRWDGVPHDLGAGGAPIFGDALGWLDCTVWAVYDGGDHSIVVGEVQDCGGVAAAAPLVYHSRSWGQFADVLTSHVVVTEVGLRSDPGVVPAAFGTDPDRPAAVEEIVDRVEQVLRTQPSVVVLDDEPGVADPLQVRRVLQSLAGVVGRTPVALRPGSHPMGLATVVVALKSGVHHLHTDPTGARWARTSDVTTMLRRMDVAVDLIAASPSTPPPTTPED